MSFTSIQLNFSPGNHVRFEQFEGREYIVAPVVMLTVGVHNGSNGPILYTEDELKKTPESWNMKPLVVYHPTRNGAGISACSAEVIQTQGVGLIMNARFDGKLRAEAWFDLEKTRKVDDRIITALEEGKMMEVSTGLFTDNEQAEGTFNSSGTEEKYVAIARNFRPDHLAILPDQIGACSIKDGAGLLQTNALSHGDQHSRIQRLLEEKYGDRSWVVDVFDKWFVFAYDGKMWKLSYTKRNDMIEFGDEPREAVVPQTVYRSVDGRVIANGVPGSTSVVVRHNSMPFTRERKMPQGNNTIVDDLIANDANQWTEDHREFLTNQSEDFLKSLLPPAPEQTQNTQPATEQTTVDPTQGQNNQPTKNNEQPAKTPQQRMEEFINNAPPEMRESLLEMRRTTDDKRNALIEKITANSANMLPKETLAAMPTQQLEGIAALAAASVPQANADEQQNAQHHVPNYAAAVGAGGSPVSNATPLDDEPLDLPWMV